MIGLESPPTLARAAGAVLSLALLLALVVAPGGAAAHPGERHHGDEHPADGIGVQVNSPDGLVGFHSAVQWGDTDVDDQTAELVYAGSGCSPPPSTRTSPLSRCTGPTRSSRCATP